MKYFLMSAVTTVMFFSSCKKELQPRSGTNNIEAQSITYNPPPPPGTCEGNEWNYDHTFYPDWYHQPSPSDMEPIVYNNKVYVPDYEDQEIRIFNGASWDYLPSQVPLYTNYHSFSFTIGSKSYIGTGLNSGRFYQYNLVTNTWVRKTDRPFNSRLGAAAFSIGSKGYMVGGMNDGNNERFKDMWEYNPMTNIWTRKADLPVPLNQMAFFVVNNKAYIACGRTNTSSSDALYEYDPETNVWSVKAPFPGGPRGGLVAFVINGKPYCGGGGSGQKDYYRYNQNSDTWTRVADMSLDFMTSTVYGFSINSSGYAVYHHSVSDNLFTVRYTPLICSLP